MSETCLRACPKHGESKFYVQRSRGYESWRCMRCNGDGVTRRRRQLKQKAVQHKGGKCLHCGYCKSVYALEFHHVDPSQKDFSLGNGNSPSWEKIVAELEKCILLCANCHREEHERLESFGV